MIIESTELVELKVQPYQKRGWIVLPVGRSIVLGPQSIEGIYLPYKIQHEGSTIFWDCLFKNLLEYGQNYAQTGSLGFFCITLALSLFIFHHLLA